MEEGKASVGFEEPWPLSAKRLMLQSKIGNMDTLAPQLEP